jgi:hypothetical protein
MCVGENGVVWARGRWLCIDTVVIGITHTGGIICVVFPWGCLLWFSFFLPDCYFPGPVESSMGKCCSQILCSQFVFLGGLVITRAPRLVEDPVAVSAMTGDESAVCTILITNPADTYSFGVVVELTVFMSRQQSIERQASTNGIFRGHSSSLVSENRHRQFRR